MKSLSKRLFCSHAFYILDKGQIIHIFPNKPTTGTRASIYHKLDTIGDFRNRVNHCVPICFIGNVIYCSVALSFLNTIYDLVNWINPELVKFFDDLNIIKNKINQNYKIY